MEEPEEQNKDIIAFRFKTPSTHIGGDRIYCRSCELSENTSLRHIHGACYGISCAANDLVTPFNPEIHIPVIAGNICTYTDCKMRNDIKTGCDKCVLQKRHNLIYTSQPVDIRGE